MIYVPPLWSSVPRARRGGALLVGLHHPASWRAHCICRDAISESRQSARTRSPTRRRQGCQLGCCHLHRDGVIPDQQHYADYSIPSHFQGKMCALIKYLRADQIRIWSQFWCRTYLRINVNCSGLSLAHLLRVVWSRQLYMSSMTKSIRNHISVQCFSCKHPTCFPAIRRSRIWPHRCWGLQQPPRCQKPQLRLPQCLRSTCSVCVSHNILASFKGVELALVALGKYV